MDKKTDFTRQLKALLPLYDFKTDRLAPYLGVTAEQVLQIAEGDAGALPEEPDARQKAIRRIRFLHYCAIERKLDPGNFLKMLTTRGKLPKETIAKFADVQVEDIDRMLADPAGEMESEAKEKITVAMLALRFFLREKE